MHITGIHMTGPTQIMPSMPPLLLLSATPTDLAPGRMITPASSPTVSVIVAIIASHRTAIGLADMDDLENVGDHRAHIRRIDADADPGDTCVDRRLVDLLASDR